MCSSDLSTPRKDARGTPGAARTTGSARKGPPPVRDEKAEATRLASRSGIPFPQALLVVRGELTLNDVLNRMWLADKFARLVHGGMDSSLAGQVVRGQLTLERAQEIQSLWRMQAGSFHSDALRPDPKTRRFLVTFHAPPLIGHVTRVSRYDVFLAPAGGENVVSLKKHDLKMHGSATALDAVLRAIVPDPKVRELSLQASTRMDDRFRPTEALAREWAATRRPLRFTFRDGDTLVGVPVRVALFEIEVDCGDGVTACLMTHALFKDRPFEVPAAR